MRDGITSAQETGGETEGGAGSGERVGIGCAGWAGGKGGVVDRAGADGADKAM